MNDEFDEGPSRFEMLYDERASELRKVKDQVALLRMLTQTPGWAHYTDVLKAQVYERQETLALTPASGVDELVAREFPRGELAGMKLALEIVQVELDALLATEAALQSEVDRFAAIDGED